MKKIKVLTLISHMGQGGAQRIVLNNMKYFKNDDVIDFSVLAIEKKSDKYCDDQIANNNLKVEYVNDIFKKVLIKIFGSKFKKYFIKKAIKRKNPDIVHVHITGLLDEVLDAIVELNIPVRFDTLHSNPFRYNGKVLDVIRDAFQNKGFIALCLNKLQLDMAKEYYGIKKYEILENGVDYGFIDKSILKKSEARKLYGLDENTFVVGAVGRLEKVKNYPLLINAFKKVLNKNENANLLIAGEGPEKQNLLDLVSKLGISDRIRFLGNIENPVYLYSAIDVYALTSESEALSLSLIEAQRCGNYCVISEGVPDESIVTTNVQKVKGNDLDKWAQAILDTNYKGKKTKGFNNYELGKSLEKTKKLYLKYWKEYVDEK